MTIIEDRLNRYLDIKPFESNRKGCQCEEGKHSCELYNELSRLLKNANESMIKEGLHRK